MSNAVNLDVLPIKEVKDTLMPTSKPISDNLPPPPFVMTLVAPVIYYYAFIRRAGTPFGIFLQLPLWIKRPNLF